jgi:nitroreductase
MRPNYQAWEVKASDFFNQKSEFDRMQFLIRFALLAPSGHNTQPWSFSIEGNEIFIWANRERSLEGSDPHRHQLLLAFGCMIENLYIAACYYDFDPTITYFPDSQNLDLIARVTIGKSRGIKEDENTSKLMSAIPLRRTNRGKYTNKQIPEEFIKAIKRYHGEEFGVSLISDPKKKDTIADIVNNAQIEAMEDPVFREELSHFIKSSFTREHAGMPGFALEIPAPISLVASQLIKKINLSKQSRKKDNELLKKYTPMFVVISSRKNDSLSWLAAGRIFERSWLMATACGLACSPMAAAIQSTQYCKQLKSILGTTFEPQVFFRVGYPVKQFDHSPRFLVEHLIRKS